MSKEAASLTGRNRDQGKRKLPVHVGYVLTEPIAGLECLARTVNLSLIPVQDDANIRSGKEQHRCAKNISQCIPSRSGVGHTQI